MKSVLKSRILRALGQRTRIARVIVAVAFAGLFTAACKDSTSPRTVTALTIISPTSPQTIPVNGTVQFTAQAKNADGDILAVKPTWSIVSGGGTISSTGLFTAGTTPGTTVIRVTCSGINVDVTITVAAGPLATITVTPNPVTLAIGAPQTFTAVGTDANGNVVAITPVWSTVNPPGSIDAGTGLFTAGGATGQFDNTVRATQGAIFGTATVIVVSTPPPAPITTLGSASVVGILAGSTVTCVTGGLVKADIDIYAGSALVGFGPCLLTGAKHLADVVAQQAQADLLVAYNQLAGLPCGTVIGTADIGSTTKAAGVYCSASTIGVTGNLTLDGGGDPNATFVFQAGSSLTGVGNIILINGAQAKNVYWVNGASATIGVSSAWQGNILAVASITLNDNVTLLGRALTRIGAVTLGNNNVITLPECRRLRGPDGRPAPAIVPDVIRKR